MSIRKYSGWRLRPDMAARGNRTRRHAQQGRKSRQNNCTRGGTDGHGGENMSPLVIKDGGCVRCRLRSADPSGREAIGSCPLSEGNKNKRHMTR
ncbi:hypothetical protein SKAU_G00288700 [Synaphobranchus kaupii]|uniref:Uncharacterized protein n=1 Tax=Synaphobranchus kaupii TaxID=118154 RepID=A0A9Q1ETA3_SYNKA|nr:hypothetical protein SKAU_G00288700 [Synaphobranchus kaupii]